MSDKSNLDHLPQKNQGKLSTHVLDTLSGKPASGVKIELYELVEGGDQKSGSWKLVKSVTTNADGRTSSPLLINDELKTGSWQLVFQAGEYFRSLPNAKSLNLPSPLFLDEVPIRFQIFDVDQNYHVPLLISPWSYSTYRGS